MLDALHSVGDAVDGGPGGLGPEPEVEVGVQLVQVELVDPLHPVWLLHVGALALGPRGRGH